jgi:hypothetical protein
MAYKTRFDLSFSVLKITENKCREIPETNSKAKKEAQNNRRLEARSPEFSECAAAAV